MGWKTLKDQIKTLKEHMAQLLMQVKSLIEKEF